MDMDRKQAILAFVEPFDILIRWRFGELAIESVGPIVVLASKDAIVPLILCHNGKGPVPTDIVEGIDSSGAILCDNKIEAGDLVS